MTITDSELASLLRPVAEALITHDDVRRARQHDRTHITGDHVRADRIKGRLPRNVRQVVRDIDVQTGENDISSAANLALQLVDFAAAILSAEAGATGNSWSLLTNGDGVSPELIFTSEGDVVMVEIPR